MRLAEPELESFLQLIVHLPCNVATKHPRDLWKPDNQLYRQSVRAYEIDFPKLYWGEGAHNFPDQGFISSMHLEPNFSFPECATLQCL